MQPTPGRIVLYTLTDADAAAITARRQAQSTAALAGQPVDVGNFVTEGQTLPAMVVRVFDGAGSACNIKVQLDGTDTYWATSRCEGTDPGNWAWPPRT